MFRVHFDNLSDRPGVGPIFRRVTGRSPWVWLTAFAVGVLPFAIVIALLALAALIVAGVLFVILGAIDDLLQNVSALFSGDTRRDEGNDGRQNVRVLRPDEP